VNPIMKSFLNVVFAELMLLLALSVPSPRFVQLWPAIAGSNFTLQVIYFLGITKNL
jgi:hypothetical protein